MLVEMMHNVTIFLIDIENCPWGSSQAQQSWHYYYAYCSNEWSNWQGDYSLVGCL